MSNNSEAKVTTTNPTALHNIEVIREFFSLYLKDKARFYSLWVDEQPSVLTPFISDDVAVCKIGVHAGWEAVRNFWDPIFDQMEGTFDWFIDEVIVGEDPNVIITKAHSVIDVQTGDAWGNKAIRYNGRYIQIFRFRDGKVESFEEYYDTALLNAQYA